MSFLELNALRVRQPLSDFFVATIKASDLMQISFAEELQYMDEGGNLKGSQRETNEKRLKEIARYIDSVEMSFPNSIILAANYEESTGMVSDVEDDRWHVKEAEGGVFKIVIPTNKSLAAIIDGQHRLKAFKHVEKDERKDLELLCSIFFDLPNSYQAFLFATINGNQKMVDKSLAMEQFGFNVQDEPPKSWTPEKLAVFFSRKLNFKESPFKGKIKVAPKYDKEVFEEMSPKSWIVSTATIVDGILTLISSKPKRDRVEMGQSHIFKGRNRKMLSDFYDSSPLRQWYIEGRDDDIFQVILDFFESVKKNLWDGAQPKSYIFKTVGVQALFDLLKKILQKFTNPDEVDFEELFSKVKKVDFSDDFFQASGIGKSRIRKVLFYANGLITEEELGDDIQNVNRLLN